MTHQQLTREMQLERANMIAHLTACRVMLATAQGIIEADKAIDAAIGTSHHTPTADKLLDTINAYMKLGMFDELPEGFTK